MDRAIEASQYIAHRPVTFPPSIIDEVAGYNDEIGAQAMDPLHSLAKPVETR